MNWLGTTPRAIAATILACVLAAWAFVALRRSGIDAPPVVGIAAGLAAASVSRARSGLRGIVVAAIAAHAAAVAEVLAQPAHGLARDLVTFAERLDGTRLGLHALSALLAAVLGARARACTVR